MDHYWEILLVALAALVGTYFDFDIAERSY